MTLTVLKNYIDSSGVSTVSDEQSLADGQTVVVFDLPNIASAGFYISGSNADNGRLADGEYTVDNEAQITLTQSYPAGTIVQALLNEPVGADITDDQVVFDNVNLMTLSGVGIGQLVETKGYYVAGDGGQASYLIEAFATTPDGYGDHLLTNGNVAVLQPVNGEINVKQFGAVGDGILQKVAYNPAIHSGGVATNYPYLITQLVSGTNDRAAIKAAGDSLVDGSTLIFPPSIGVYNVGQGESGSTNFWDNAIIDLINLKDITIKSDNKKIFSYHDLTLESQLIIGVQGCHNVDIKGLDIEVQCVGYPDSNQIGAPALTFGNGIVIVPQNGPVEWPNIVDVVARNASTNVNVNGNSFRITHPDGAYPGAAGALAGSGKIMGVVFYGDYVAADNPGDLPPPDLSLIENCIAENNTFLESQGRLIWGWMTNNLHVNDNRYLSQCGGAKPPIRMLHLNNNLKVHNNYIEGGDDWSNKFPLFHEPLIAVSANNGNWVNSNVDASNNYVYCQNGTGILFGNVAFGNISNNQTRVYRGFPFVEDENNNRALIMMNSIGNIESIVEGIVCEGNTVRSGVNGIRAEGVLDCLINSNDLAGQRRTGIVVQGIDQNIVSDNSLRNMVEEGIFIAHSGAWAYGGNVTVNDNYVHCASLVDTLGINYSSGSGDFEPLIFKNNIVKNAAQGYRADIGSSISINNIAIGCTADTSDPTINIAQPFVFGSDIIGTGNASGVVEAGAGYYKYADGMLVCYGVVTMPPDAAMTARGVLFSSAWVSSVFAHPFLAGEVPSSSYTTKDSALNYMTPTASNGTTNTTLETFILAPQVNHNGGDLVYTAIGRWK